LFSGCDIIVQKQEVASHIFSSLQSDLSYQRSSYENTINSLRAVLQETDIRLAELRKDAFEFKREIVVGAESMRTGRIMAEKVL